jgi:hypothetical protein
MPEKTDQLIDPELQPLDDGSNTNGVGVSPQLLSVPHQSQQPPQFQPPQQQWQQPMPLQQEWQSRPPMYPTPQYQYPPQMPPPQMAPQKPKSRRRLWLIIGVVVIVLIVIGSIASNASKNSQPTTTTRPATTGQPPQPTTQPALQPTSPPTQANTIGQPVQVGDTWMVTVNSVKKSSGDDISTPKAGNTFLVFNVTLKNTSSTKQDVSSILMFIVRDATGQQYNETITTFTKSPPDGTVSPGSLLRGELVYEVPASMHTFTFTFQSDFAGNVTADWNIKV